MALDTVINTGEKPAERKLLGDPAGLRGLTRTPGGTDSVPGVKAFLTQPSQETGPDSKKNIPDLAAPDENDRADDLDAKTYQKSAPNTKAPSTPIAEFNKVRGQLPTALTPSVMQRPIVINNRNNSDEDHEVKSRLKDISYIPLGGKEVLIAEGLASRETVASSNDQSLSRNYGYDGYDSFTQWQEQVDQNNALIDSLQRQIDYNDLRQAQILQSFEYNQRKIESLQQQRETISVERDSLVKEIKDANQGMIDTGIAMESAKAILDDKIKEKYPDGKQPVYGQPDPVADAEKKLHEDAYNKHRDEVHAFYTSAGHEEDFLVMERAAKGEKVSESDTQKALANLQGAKLPYDPDIVLVDIMRRSDPSNAFLDTKRTAEIGVEKAWQSRDEATAKYLEVQDKHLDDKVKEMDQQMSAIDQSIKDIQATDAESAKELKRLQDEKTDLTKKLEEAKAYDKVLNDPATKSALANGTMTLNQLKAQAPKFIQEEGYIDTGLACVDPASQQGQKLMTEIQNQDPAAATTAPRTTSAAGSTIKGPDVQTAFNNAVDQTSTSTSPAVPTLERNVTISSPAPAQLK